MSSNFFSIIFLAILLKEVVGHGMMIEPPNRASIWRFNATAGIVDEDDDANWCGGPYVQVDNGGLCGVCGDSYTDPHPQDNENTGKYGRGYVVKTYGSGSVIDVQINLTINHLGAYSFSVCTLIDSDAPEAGEDCFVPVLFEDGSTYYNVAEDDSVVSHRVQLPEATCDRCVLRWDYNTAKTYGQCDDGTSAMGCGPLETFRSCSDITIV